jgi:hypothetical protein
VNGTRGMNAAARAKFMRKIKQSDAEFARLFEEPEYSVELFIRHGVELTN